MKDFLNEYEVGYTLDPNNAEQLADKLIWMKDNPQAVSLMGEKALIIAKRFFDKDFLSNKMLDILVKVYESK